MQLQALDSSPKIPGRKKILQSQESPPISPKPQPNNTKPQSTYLGNGEARQKLQARLASPGPSEQSVVVVASELGTTSCPWKCTICRQVRIEKTANLIRCCCCCCVPHFFKCTKDVRHFCPLCGAYLGKNAKI